MLPIESSYEYLDLSWEMFGELCRALALKVARDYDPDVVVGIARAGALPGAVVATILGADFYSMIISRKGVDDEERERPEILSAAPREVEGQRVLIVDEVTTSGATLRPRARRGARHPPHRSPDRHQFRAHPRLQAGLLRARDRCRGGPPLGITTSWRTTSSSRTHGTGTRWTRRRGTSRPASLGHLAYFFTRFLGGRLTLS